MMNLCAVRLRDEHIQLGYTDRDLESDGSSTRFHGELNAQQDVVRRRKDGIRDRAIGPAHRAGSRRLGALRDEQERLATVGDATRFVEDRLE